MFLFVNQQSIKLKNNKYKPFLFCFLKNIVLNLNLKFNYVKKDI